MLFGYQLVKSLYLRIIRTDKALCICQRVYPRFQLIYIRSKPEISETVKTPELTTASGDIIGKMIDDYKWKLAATFTEGQAAVLTENTNVRLILGADQTEITAKVENVEKYDNDYVAIFSADDLNSVIASSRVGRFKLLVDSYNGCPEVSRTMT